MASSRVFSVFREMDRQYRGLVVCKRAVTMGKWVTWAGVMLWGRTFSA